MSIDQITPDNIAHVVDRLGPSTVDRIAHALDVAPNSSILRAALSSMLASGYLREHTVDSGTVEYGPGRPFPAHGHRPVAIDAVPAPQPSAAPGNTLAVHAGPVARRQPVGVAPGTVPHPRDRSDDACTSRISDSAHPFVNFDVDPGDGDRCGRPATDAIHARPVTAPAVDAYALDYCTATPYAGGHPFEHDSVFLDEDGYDDWERCGRRPEDPVHGSGIDPANAWYDEPSRHPHGGAS